MPAKDSPLAPPLECVQNFTRYILKVRRDDRPFTEFGLATALSVVLGHESEPVWGYIIGPAGCGKTELLMALEGWPDPSAKSGRKVELVSDLTINALMSANPITGDEASLLPLLKDRVLAVKDFTVILQKPRDEQAAILAQLRDIFDGQFNKRSGTEGEQRFDGRIGFLAGVTPMIEAQMRGNHVLGERCLAVRMFRRPWKSREEQYRKTVEAVRYSTQKDKWKEGYKLMVRNAMVRAEQFARRCIRRHGRPVVEARRLRQLAMLAGLLVDLRSQPLNDGLATTTEVPNRVVQQLRNLADCRMYMGFRRTWDESDVRFLARVVEDSMPLAKVRIVRALLRRADSQGWVDWDILKRVSQMDGTALGRAIRQWQEVRVAERKDGAVRGVRTSKVRLNAEVRTAIEETGFMRSRDVQRN